MTAYDLRLPLQLADSDLGTILDAGGTFIARAAGRDVGQVMVDALNATPRPEQPKRTGAAGVGMPAMLHLNMFGREIDMAFGHVPYLVGSAAVGKSWRDVDVRLILPDDEFDALFPAIVGEPGTLDDARWALLCAAIAELGRQRTGLPIDFQIQRQSNANERYGDRTRHALGLYLTEYRATTPDAAQNADGAPKNEPR